MVPTFITLKPCSQAIKQQWGIQTWFNRLEIRLLNVTSIFFIVSFQSCCFFNALMSSRPSARPQMLYAAPQEGPQLLPAEQKPSHGLLQGFLTHLPLTAKLSGNFWRPLPLFHTADRRVHQSILVKREEKENSIGPTCNWTDNFSWARSPFGSQQLWCDLPAWPGQVQSYANHYSQFFSLQQNFSNSFTFCSNNHACLLTRALRAEGRLCWKIKPKAPVGATEDQIIRRAENCHEIAVLNHKWRNKRKTICKDHLLFKAFFS